MKLCRIGYDEIPRYSFEELVLLYLDEGKTLDEALELSKKLFPEMKRLLWNERSSWRRCRIREMTGYGLSPLIEGE